MVTDDIKHWRIEDPAPGVPLDAIFPMSARARALLVRNRNHPVLSTDFLRIYGAVDMTAGLDYHQSRFMELISLLQSVDEPHAAKTHLTHEAVAYVNRLGQFHSFACSNRIKQMVSDVEALIPKISELLIFRRKHSAHRSMDKPWGEDNPHLQWVHAFALSSLSVSLFLPKQPVFLPIGKEAYQKCYLAYQINMGDQKVAELVIERDHDVIMNETYSVVAALFK
jgi:hypothetical protein